LALLAWLGTLWTYSSARRAVPRATLLTDLSWKHKGFGMFSPNRELLARQDPKSLVISFWEVSTGQKRLELTGFTDLVFNSCFSLDGRRFATPNRDGTVQVWDVDSGKELAKLRICIHDAPASVCVALSPTGERLISMDVEDETPKLWDVKTGKILASSQRHADSFVLSPDGRALATESMRPSSTKIWEIETGKDICIIPGRPVSFFGNARLLTDGHSVLMTDPAVGTIIIWDLATGQKQTSYEVVPGICVSELSPDGSKLLAGYSADAPELRLAERLIGYEQAQRMFPDERGVMLMDLETGRTLARLPQDMCNMPVFFPDGKRFAAYCKTDDSIKLWDVPPRTEFRILPVGAMLGTAIILSYLWWYTGRPKEPAPSSRV